MVYKNWKPVTCCSAILLVTLFTANAYAQHRSFNLPAQEATKSLPEFARQAGIQIAAPSEQLKGMWTPQIKGEFDIREALKQLLLGTGLTVASDDNGMIVLQKASARLEGTATTPSHANGKAAEPRLVQVTGEQDESQRNSAATSGEAKDKSAKIEEIVVTAQKREERLQDVPISISVLDGDDLDSAAGITEIKDALARVPGVAVNNFANWGAQVAIRGVASSLAVLNGSSTTAYYLDSVPFGFVRSALGPEIGPYDLDRVEVLRGPQGTLYGANALNGVVRVLTKDASLDGFDLKGRVSTSSSEKSASMNYRGDMAVNVPIIEDRLAARAVVSYQDWSGWVDKPNRKDANDAQLSAMRLKVKAQPTDELSIDASVWLDRARYAAPSNGTPDGMHVRPGDEPMDRDFDAYNFKIGYDFPSFTITSATSYLDYGAQSVLDLPPDLDTLFGAKTFAQEINLLSTHEGSWRWSLGGLYRDAEELFYQEFGVVPLINDFTSGSDSFAVFGELTYAFLEDRLELTGGLRYFEDTQTMVTRGFFGSAVTPPDRNEASFGKWTPRMILTYRPGDQMMLYASYGQGYRSGGHQVLNARNLAAAQGLDLQPFRPDALTNYEIGAKGGIFDGRAAFDLALYYMDWKDQVQTVGLVSPSGLLIPALVNSESASGVGVDAGLIVKLVEGLELGANLSWNDLKMDADLISGTVTLFEQGGRLDSSAEWTLGSSLSYAFPLGGAGFTGRFGAAVNYTSSILRTLISGNAALPIPSDPITVGRVSFTIDAPEHWSLTAYAENINNWNGVLGSPHPSENLQTRLRPRTIGLQLNYEF